MLGTKIAYARKWMEHLKEKMLNMDFYLGQMLKVNL